MTTLEMALNPLDRYKGTRKPDEVRKSDVVVDKTIDGVLENYEQALDFSVSTWYDDIKALAYKTILTPEQITQFLKATKAFESYDDYVWNTGYFVSGLIQKSYDAGNNDFVLDTRNLPDIKSLCSFLKGKGNKRLKVTFNGDTGVDCGNDIMYISFKAQKLGESSLMNPKNCKIEVQEAGDNFAKNAKNCNIEVQEVGYGCGQEAIVSVFKTKVPATFKKLYQVTRHGANIVQLLDAKGKVLETVQ